MLNRVISFIALMLLMLSSFFANIARAADGPASGLVGFWEHNGSVYQYTNDGRIMYEDDVMYYSPAGEGKIRIMREAADSTTDSDMIAMYTINDDGTMTMNGIIYYPARDAG